MQASLSLDILWIKRKNLTREFLFRIWRFEEQRVGLFALDFGVDVCFKIPFT